MGRDERSKRCDPHLTLITCRTSSSNGIVGCRRKVLERACVDYKGAILIAFPISRPRHRKHDRAWSLRFHKPMMQRAVVHGGWNVTELSRNLVDHAVSRRGIIEGIYLTKTGETESLEMYFELLTSFHNLAQKYYISQQYSDLRSKIIYTLQTRWSPDSSPSLQTDSN
jgi:hypothetical protein